MLNIFKIGHGFLKILENTKNVIDVYLWYLTSSNSIDLDLQQLKSSLCFLIEVNICLKHFQN